MVSKYVEPSIRSRSFSCPHCGAHTGQTWFNVLCDQVKGEQKLPFRPTQEDIEMVRSARREPTQADALEQHIANMERMIRGEVFFEASGKSPYQPPELQNVSVSLCHICRRPGVWIRDSVVYPPLRSGAEPAEDMPPEVLADYEEARSITALSPRGAAALLRLCVQKLCEHLGEKGKLDDAIAALVKKGLDPRVQKALDIVRVIGNESVHPGQIDLRDDPQAATELFRLVNLIVEVMISQPKHIDAMYSGLPESKRQAIEKRDKVILPK